MPKLKAAELVSLVRSVFPRYPDDRCLAILVDIPRRPESDNPAWRERRKLAEGWFRAFKRHSAEIPLEAVKLIAYPDTGSNNADLPERATLINSRLPSVAGDLERFGKPALFEEVFGETQLFLAPTEYSTTAPLKNAAKRFGFRAATMPGFTPSMIPALRIDYGEVSRRVWLLKERLDRAAAAEIRLVVDGRQEFRVFFDLRWRKAHTSSGRFPDKGTAGNLPSGETYIVPYEGERSEPSRTGGTLPVELNKEIVLFRIKENKAVAVEGDGPEAGSEADHLKREPAYGNMAELGFGVLADFGVRPTGEILLDEKLGLHVAFGRSDHFGGIIGPADFSSPGEVIHLDRIYIPATQPRIQVESVVLEYEGGTSEKIMHEGEYLIF
jgi:hypothetical protein